MASETLDRSIPVETVEALAKGGADINQRLEGGATPLIAASSNGKTETVKALIGLGADVNAKDNGGMTALYYAAHEAFSEIARVLVDNGAEPRINIAFAARAGLASRTNTLLSIPMLFFMASAEHFPSLTKSLDVGGGSLPLYWILAIVVIGIAEAGALLGPGLPTQKPLASVKGTIHAGFAVAIVLFALQYKLL